MKEFYRSRKISRNSEKSFVESCRKCATHVEVSVAQRFSSLIFLEENVKSARKCTGASENLAQARVDFAKRAKKQYIMHT